MLQFKLYPYSSVQNVLGERTGTNFPGKLGPEAAMNGSGEGWLPLPVKPDSSQRLNLTNFSLAKSRSITLIQVSVHYTYHIIWSGGADGVG